VAINPFIIRVCSSSSITLNFAYLRVASDSADLTDSLYVQISVARINVYLMRSKTVSFAH